MRRSIDRLMDFWGDLGLWSQYGLCTVLALVALGLLPLLPIGG